MKNDIKLAIANAYSDYFIHNKKQIKINSPDLPDELKNMLNTQLSQERVLLDSLDMVGWLFLYDKIP
ncbi:hypothetical protein [Clostridium sp. KNHs214]|uniref:hypothetical protein n=1 Tax=Clostridium sp. KNHs214 TaxID=1540257 RepID=UPI00068A6319|nr:hypothetical protein [Clostridium sp. KNHs214]